MLILIHFKIRKALKVTCRREVAANFIEKQDFGTQRKPKDERWNLNYLKIGIWGIILKSKVEQRQKDMWLESGHAPCRVESWTWGTLNTSCMSFLKPRWRWDDEFCRMMSVLKLEIEWESVKSTPRWSCRWGVLWTRHHFTLGGTIPRSWIDGLHFLDCRPVA